MKAMKPSTRRKFLLAASLGSAGAVAAAATKGVATCDEASKPKAAQADGYRLSEHIQKYYKTTEV